MDFFAVFFFSTRTPGACRWIPALLEQTVYLGAQHDQPVQRLQIEAWNFHGALP
ncbi:hypothetical protein [Bradyrhizobium sp. I1.7.5]|uniref:hypothetical protein n=1 Tax=Bradyrhizobium sp. I1.7.5 TaxID=3156363 RepID=UPI00339A56B9